MTVYPLVYLHVYRSSTAVYAAIYRPVYLTAASSARARTGRSSGEPDSPVRTDREDES